MTDHFPILIIGGGTAGLTVAARLCNQPHAPAVGIVEPSSKHYYQPLWTLVGAGVFPREATERDEADYIPDGATWIRDAVDGFEPEANAVVLRSGKRLTYDQLVVAAGIQLDWDRVDGLTDALGEDGVCSNYAYEQVHKTWAFLEAFEGGKAVFTFPATPIKCGGAPQKIMYLAEHWMRRKGVRSRSEVIYASSTAGIFGVPKYKRALQKIVDARGITAHYRRNLTALRPASKEAVFEDLDGGEELVLNYDFIHVTPPQSAPDFIAQSPLANEEGWVDVDKFSTRHVRYPNVFSLGDCSSLPAAKTGAAVRKQAPVLVENLMALRMGRALDAAYDGYASCPLVTGYGEVMLAEFDYSGQPAETFPFDQAKPRFSMYALKAYGLPQLYWNGMLRGHA